METKIERIDIKDKRDFLGEIYQEVKNELSAEEREVFQLVGEYQEFAPDMEEFESLYSSAEIKADQEELRKKEERAFKEMKREDKINYIKAKISEALLTNIIESYWMPENIYITETSKFDDWMNGVDSIIEIEDKPEKAGIIDFTTAVEKTNVGAKILRILENIEKGTLFKAKYFKSQQTDQKHYLKMIPGVVVGIASKNLQELCELYCKREKKEIARHWFQYCLFDQILTQINYYQNYILNPKRKNYEPKKARLLSQKYEDLKQTIKSIKQNPLVKLKQKGISLTAWRKNMAKKDKVYANILGYIT